MRKLRLRVVSQGHSMKKRGGTSPLWTSSSKHQLGTQRSGAALQLKKQQYSLFVSSAPFPLGHQSHCTFCFHGGNCNGTVPGQRSPAQAPHQNDKRPTKSEPEPTQQWDWHQLLNFCLDSKQFHQAPRLHNMMNKMPTFCWADWCYRKFTHSLIPGDLVDRAVRIIQLRFTFRIWLCSQPNHSIWNLNSLAKSSWGRQRER